VVVIGGLKLTAPLKSQLPSKLVACAGAAAASAAAAMMIAALT
jgi:hypothetical protein